MIGSVVGNIGQGLTARRMVRDQKKALAELKESDYIAPGLAQAVDRSEKAANATRYSGQDIDESNIRQSSANALNNASRATTSSNNLLNAAMAIQGNQNKAMQGVSQNLAQSRSRNSSNFTNLLLQKANAQLNNRKQYEATKSALQGAIMQNRARANNAFWNAAGGGLDYITTLNGQSGNMSSLTGGGQTGQAGQSAQAGKVGQAASLMQLFCWVAREVFGVEDNKWLLFRLWLLEDAPKWFYNAYLKYGERFALWIHNKPRVKLVIRYWMLSRINKKFPGIILE